LMCGSKLKGKMNRIENLPSERLLLAIEVAAC
jgi:hypothetical protein